MAPRNQQPLVSEVWAEPAALLFDLDGTMIDSDPLHAEIFIALFAEYGREIDTAFYTAEIHGRRNTEVFAQHLPQVDADAMSDEKEARFRAMLGDRAEPVVGLIDLLDRSRRIPRAVVTNAPAENARAMLSAIGVKDRFEVVVTEADAPHGKPAPEPYILATERLGISPVHAMAFEDSRTGISSAIAAGIGCVVGMTTSMSPTELTLAGAHIAARDFTDTALLAHIFAPQGARE